MREKAVAPHSSTLAWKTHGWRSLVGCSPWVLQESDTTEWLHFHFSLFCIGEGNGNPLQYSCLENHRDGGAWQAAVYGVSQSQTRLNRLSSSSKSAFLALILQKSGNLALTVLWELLHTLLVLHNQQVILSTDCVLSLALGTGRQE